MATPHLLPFFFPPPPYIDNYIKQHIKATGWCRALLLWTLHSSTWKSTPSGVCGSVLSPHQTGWSHSPEQSWLCNNCVPGVVFMQPFPKAAPAPACFSPVLTPRLRELLLEVFLELCPPIPLLAASPSAGLVNPTQTHWESVLGRRTWSLNRNLRQVELGWEMCKLSVRSHICIPRFVRLCLSVVSWCLLLLGAFQWIHERKILPWAPRDPNPSPVLGLHWSQGFYLPLESRLLLIKILCVDLDHTVQLSLPPLWVQVPVTTVWWGVKLLCVYSQLHGQVSNLNCFGSVPAAVGLNGSGIITPTCSCKKS